MPQEDRSKTRLLIAVGVPFLTFLAGVLGQTIFDGFSNKVLTTSDRIVLAILAGVALMVVIFAFIEVAEVRDRWRHRGEINASLEEISRKFGISVEFVPDMEDGVTGATYRRTEKLVQAAQVSLVFVDFWVATGDYLKDKPNARDSRDSYYDSILSCSRARPIRSDGQIFHRRIVQMPELGNDGSPFTLSADQRFTSYLERCLEIQDDGPGRSLVKIAPPYVHAHFAIIDDRFVVLPILTSHPKKGGLTRHGALIFDDAQGVYVKQLMAIYNMIDSFAHPLEKEHLR